MEEDERKGKEVLEKKKHREEGRDEMLAEVLTLLSIKKQEERRARDKERDRIAQETAEKKRKEAEAARNAERKLGTEREKARCLKRDEKYTGASAWTPALAFGRFEAILLIEEFSKIKFTDSKPLIFEALPWPVLDVPGRFTGEDITAVKVLMFFASPSAASATSASYPKPGQYRKYLLKQCLLAFHGDKMTSFDFPYMYMTLMPTAPASCERAQVFAAALAQSTTPETMFVPLADASPDHLLPAPTLPAPKAIEFRPVASMSAVIAQSVQQDLRQQVDVTPALKALVRYAVPLHKLVVVRP
ncbi:hypothetical protein B0H10DRAFT_2237940 [Mycena sp. CBHHK59/15]|nr:hypothetical protein B0H10DRAFT_2237940 [Mycena sp. CBHHK59/15]